MNLHSLANSAIKSVNPNVTISLLRSTGFAIDATHKQVPTYATFSGTAQIQPVTWRDLQKLNDLNMQGTARRVYLYGNWFGVVRAAQLGGDILQFAESAGDPVVRNWLVVNTTESWPDWTNVLVVLQA